MNRFVAMKRYPGFLASALLLATPLAMATPTVAEDYHYYTIAPENSQDLAAAIDRASPVHEGGKIAHAATHWDLHWTFHFWNSADKACVVKQVNTTVNIGYTLPQLENTVKDEATIQAFQDYFSALRERERQRAKIGIDAANEVESTLMSISAANCSAAETLANERAEKILQHYRQLDQDFTLSTPAAPVQAGNH